MYLLYFPSGPNDFKFLKKRDTHRDLTNDLCVCLKFETIKEAENFCSLDVHYKRLVDKGDLIIYDELNLLIKEIIE